MWMNGALNKVHLRSSDSSPDPHCKCSSYTSPYLTFLISQTIQVHGNTVVAKQIALSLSSFAFTAFSGHLSVLIFVLNIVCLIITDANFLCLLRAVDPSFLWGLKAKNKQERKFMVMILFWWRPETFSVKGTILIRAHVSLEYLHRHIRMPGISRMLGEQYVPL